MTTSKPPELPLVAIVGIGALGSHVALFLRNAARLKVIDFDRVEAKNLLSQFHHRQATAKLKVESLKQTMSLLFNVQVATASVRLAWDNADVLLKDARLVIDCVDNAASRRLIQRYAEQAGLPVLHGALAMNGEYGRVGWRESFRVDDEDPNAEATCEDGAFLPFIATVASYVADAAQRYLKTGARRDINVTPRGAVVVREESEESKS